MLSDKKASFEKPSTISSLLNLPCKMSTELTFAKFYQIILLCAIVLSLENFFFFGFFRTDARAL